MFRRSVGFRYGSLAAGLLAVVAQAQDFAGRVVEDSSGEPVASAELKIHKAGLRELVADLETDRAGRFAGADLPPGEYTIDVVKPNFVTTTFPVHLPNTAVTIRTLRYGVMDGHVTNMRGEPAAGRVTNHGQTIGATRITVLTKQPGSEEFRSVRDTSPEEGGHYRFFDLPPGQYELGMWYYGLSDGSGMQLYPDNTNPRVFTIAGGEVYKDLNFLITPNPQFGVSGRVESPTPGAEFVLALGMPDQPVLPVAVALAGKDGNFQFDKVPAGTYDLFASGPTGGYTAFESVLGKGDALFGKMRVQVAGSDLTGLSVAVAPARSVSVVLRSHAGVPFPVECAQSGTVTLTSLDPWAVAFFGATGSVSVAKEQTIPNLAPGRFRIAASELGAGCYQASDLIVDLSKDVPQPVAVEVAAAGSIHGTVRAASGRATDCVVQLLDPANGEGAQSRLAFPDADGNFALTTLRPGKYRIAVRTATGASKARWVSDISQMTEVDVTGGDATKVELTAPAEQGVAQ
jgi:hypothetical protein